MRRQNDRVITLWDYPRLISKRSTVQLIKSKISQFEKRTGGYIELQSLIEMRAQLPESSGQNRATLT